MSTMLEVAKTMNKAWHDKDEAAVRQCFHKEYSFSQVP